MGHHGLWSVWGNAKMKRKESEENKRLMVEEVSELRVSGWLRFKSADQIFSQSSSCTHCRGNNPLLQFYWTLIGFSLIIRCTLSNAPILAFRKLKPR